MRGLSNSGTAGRAVSAADFDVGGARINRHRCSESAPAVTMKLSLELIRVVQMEAPRIPRWEPPPLLIGPRWRLDLLRTAAAGKEENVL